MPSKISLLLIEDDIYDAEIVIDAVHRIGANLFDLVHVTRFIDAIEQIEKREFNAVILDLGLPDSAGLGGVKRLISRIPHCPIIVLTGLDDEDAAIRGIELGVQEFLEKKDIEPRRLIRAIRHAIKRKQHALGRQSHLSVNRIGEQITQLGSIIEQTCAAVCADAESLRATGLTEEQKPILAGIEERSKESLLAARKAQSVDKSSFFEVDVRGEANS